jgi:glycosyltransferase involved in cell wall biosynthesis
LKLIQVSHAITANDAASNQIIAMDDAFKQLGYDSEIYSNKIDKTLLGIVKPFSELKPDKDNIIIYHFSTGTSFTKKILNYPYPVAIYYHNITPAKYYFGNAWGSWWNCLKGRRQLSSLKNKTFFSWCASGYSQQELKENGFSDSYVLPIILDYDKYKLPVNQSIYDKYKDGHVNLLFVGRVVPHKCQHDLIMILDHYKKNINDKVRLFLVGGQKKSYVKKLQKIINEKGLQDDVILTDKVSYTDLCTYYQASDLFLSMSEHEGFGVPLIESMIYDKPVLAYDCTAVAETVGDAGVLFKDKDYVVIANTVFKTITSDSMGEQRHIRLEQLSKDNIFETLKKDIEIMESLYKP